MNRTSFIQEDDTSWKDSKKDFSEGFRTMTDFRSGSPRAVVPFGHTAHQTWKGGDMIFPKANRWQKEKEDTSVPATFIYSSFLPSVQASRFRKGSAAGYA